MSSPIYNPPVPYNGPIHGGFLPGRMVRVQGRVHPSANSLTINLQTGPSPYDDVALHVNPRFNESAIVRNARMQSTWGAEERHGPSLPIYRDQNFEILILSEASAFKIAVNGQHFAEFSHRVVPLDRINHLNVEGDLTVSLIQFDGTVTQTSTYSASAPPMGYGQSGGSPYPPASALPATGFVMPGSAPAAPYSSSPYPSAPGGGGYPPAQPPPYGGYPPQHHAAPAPGGYYPQQPQPGYPQQPGGAYPGAGQPGGYYNPGGAHPPHHGSGSSGGGLLGDASKLLAGGLAGVGLAKVANKIPGMGGGHHGGHHGGHGYGHHGGGHHSGGGGPLGGILGSAAALGIGGALANKGMKKQKKNNLLKYGVPVGGAVLGGYALKKGMKGFGHHGHHGSSSSSSSSSEEE